MPFFNFQNNDAGDALFIDGEITSESYWWEPEGLVVARRFRQQLAKCGDVTVYINSPGGDVFAGAEIYTMLREHPGKVTVKISGIAASAASVIAMAGDEVLISPCGYMMIHDPWTFCAGNARDFEKEAEVLREITKGIINAYIEKTGKSEEELRELLEAETYMSAEVAIREGFADGMLYAEDILSEATRNLDQQNSTGGMMRAKNYAPNVVFAKMHAVMSAPGANLPQPEEDPEEPQSPYDRKDARAEIARRAEIIKNLYQEE